ncbi:hypothetical protein VPIG_00003 [Vibrio phage PWH3a-P1]|uniref:hypothetical protein n=1 Tax=Vibrio phage PWH3a-P1 TaxID=754058 RepID=UPI0002C05950|nr:hypothetical protein VPIG_00003 [Vibrio phage PWH3a-P1]AGH31861.1 hypothetical protein VPIG_00003 [Vibrio phage PWH3a-P1]
MKNYEVLVPITGYIIVEVEADNEKEAIEKAFESDELNIDNINEWDTHEAIVQGNVFYGIQNEIEVEEI